MQINSFLELSKMPGIFRKEFCITNNNTYFPVILIYHLLYYKIQSVFIINQYRQ